MTILFLNGCTSSGKSSLARALQAALPGLWLVTGIDQAIGMAPLSLHHTPEGFHFDEDEGGLVRLNFGASGQALLAAHRRSAAAIASHGVNLILDEVLATPDMLGLWREALLGQDVIWVGVHCALDELERREVARGDRRIGQARGQFDKIHRDCVYDIEIDSTFKSADQLSLEVVSALSNRF
jgi:chloramphenicol 3-O phosphotransferase